jgi:hypothetical protein
VAGLLFLKVRRSTLDHAQLRPLVRIEWCRAWWWRPNIVV